MSYRHSCARMLFQKIKTMFDNSLEILINHGGLAAVLILHRDSLVGNRFF